MYQVLEIIKIQKINKILPSRSLQFFVWFGLVWFFQFGWFLFCLFPIQLVGILVPGPRIESRPWQ